VRRRGQVEDSGDGGGGRYHDGHDRSGERAFGASGDHHRAVGNADLTQASPSSTTGNGGSEPVRTDVALVGRGGVVKPSSVNVAPFVSVRIALTSGDGRAYRLSGAGLQLTVGQGKRSASGRLAGLRTGASYKLTGTSKVVITSSGEPGP